MPQHESAPTSVIVPGLFGGMNQSQGRELISLVESPNVQNMWVKKGVLEKRTGYIDETKTNLTGTFLHGHHYQDNISGAKNFWAFTTNMAAYKSSLGGNFTDKTNSMNIKSGLDQYWSTTEIVDLSDRKTYLICCQNHTDPKTAANGTLGTNDGVVWYLDSPTANLRTLLGGDGYNADDTEHRCKWVVSYASHLFLLNTVLEVSAGSYQALPYRVRWITLAEFNASGDWDDTDTTKTAGFKDLITNKGGNVIRGELLRNTLMIYQQKAIVSCNQTNDSSEPFRFDVMIPNIGLYSVRLFASNGESHFFVGNNRQIYQYFGGRDLRAIGDPIREEFFSDINKGSASNPYKTRDRSWAMIFTDIQAVGFFICTTSATPDRFYLYFWRDKRWFKGKPGDDLMGFGEWERDTLAGNYENIPLIGGDGATDFYRWDYADIDDVSATGVTVAIDAFVQSKDFVIDLKNEYRGIDLWFEASGDGAASTVDVSVISSTTTNEDDSSWKTSTITLTSDWALYHVNFNVSGYLMKFQFRNKTVNEKLRLGGFRFEIKQQERRG